MMKNLNFKLFLIGLLGSFVTGTFISNVLAADESPAEKQKKLYRVIDQHGNVSYSDSPSPGAKEIVLPDPPTIKIIGTPEVKFDDSVKSTNKRVQSNESIELYSKVIFSNITNDGVIRNNGGFITLTALLEPALRSGHFVKFFLDGKPLGEQQNELTVTVENIEYGPHIASFSIVNSKGVVVQSSEPIKFNLLHIVRRKTGMIFGVDDLNRFDNYIAFN